MKTYNILHLEDSEIDADLVKRVVTLGGLHCNFLLVDNKEDFIKGLEHHQPDMILSDHTLPSFNSKKAYVLAKEMYPDIPFLLVTGTVSEEFAVQMIKIGVDDYLLKSNLQRLPMAISNAFAKRAGDEKIKAMRWELQQSEAHLRSIFDNSTNGIILLDKNCNILELNSRANHFTKLAFSNQLKKRDSLVEQLPEYRKQEFADKFAAVLIGEAVNYESAYVQTMGKKIYFQVYMYPIVTHEGSISGACMNFEDITERKISDGQRKRLAERLQLATKSVNMGIWDWDLETNTVEADEGMYIMYGITAADFNSVYSGWVSRVHNEDSLRVANEVHLAITNKKDYDTEFRIVLNDSSIHYIKATGIVKRDEEGKAIRMVGTNLDITSQKEKEQHLTLLESVITNTSDAVLITEAEPFDEPGPRILFVNEAFTKMTGYTAAEVMGKTPRILQGPKSDMQELKKLSRAIRKLQPFETSIINYRKNGEEFWNNFLITPVTNETGFCTHWIAIERDITEQKLIEINLKQLNEDLKDHVKKLALSNEELEQFAFVASHDLQEPLRMVTNYLTQLERKYGDVLDDKAKKYIGFAVDGAKRMRQTILDLLEFSRIGKTAETEKLLELNELISEIKILLAEKITEKKATLVIDNLPTIYADITPIRQVFQNLIANALEYSLNDIPVQIHVSAEETEDFWQFALADNGIGISKEYHEKIFVIFQRLHSKEDHPGTGLGLAITKKIIEGHGGKIWVESGEGEGSTFYFTIKK